MEQNKANPRISKITPEKLLGLLEMAHMLKKAIEKQDQQKIKAITDNIELLLDIIGYILENLNNPNVDQELLRVLLKFLGIEHNKKKEKTEEEELIESEISEEYKQHLYRMICYEVYKILNPNQLAGETAIDNFITNVHVRGINIAMKYEGHEYADQFKHRDLENLESHGTGFVAMLEQQGFKGGGFSK